VESLGRQKLIRGRPLTPPVLPYKHLRLPTTLVAVLPLILIGWCGCRYVPSLWKATVEFVHFPSSRALVLLTLTSVTSSYCTSYNYPPVALPSLLCYKAAGHALILIYFFSSSFLFVLLMDSCDVELEL
jgi:hypothetical protein